MDQPGHCQVGVEDEAAAACVTVTRQEDTFLMVCAAHRGAVVVTAVGMTRRRARLREVGAGCLFHAFSRRGFYHHEVGEQGGGTEEADDEEAAEKFSADPEESQPQASAPAGAPSQGEPLDVAQGSLHNRSFSPCCWPLARHRIVTLNLEASLSMRREKFYPMGLKRRRWICLRRSSFAPQAIRLEGSADAASWLSVARGKEEELA